MNIEEFREHCLAVKGAEEYLDMGILGFKVMGKVFAYVRMEPADGVLRAALKCDADRSMELRDRYAGVRETEFKTPLWNAVALESDVRDELIAELVRHSADEVIKKLPKKKQEEYRGL